MGALAVVPCARYRGTLPLKSAPRLVSRASPMEDGMSSPEGSAHTVIPRAKLDADIIFPTINIVQRKKN